MAHKCSCGECSCDKEIRVSFCPKCNSTDIKYVFGLSNAFGIIPKQRCGNCGVEAPAFPILVTSKKLLSGSKKKSSKKSKGKVKKK